MEPDGVAADGPARRLVNGVEIAVWEHGEGPPLICIHETAGDASVWEPFAAAAATAGMRTIRYDRRGWGSSTAPDGYRRTTVSEQAEDAAGLLDASGAGEAAVIGAGLGAVAALDLALRRPELCSAVALVEPPLLAFLPEATEGLSADRAKIEEAVREGGPEAAFDLYVSGGLPYLGAGAGRLPPSGAGTARSAARSLFAELAAVAEWEITTAALLDCAVPAAIVLAHSTPPILRSAADELAGRLAMSQIVRLGGDGLPHVTAAPELARRVADAASG